MCSYLKRHTCPVIEKHGNVVIDFKRVGFEKLVLKFICKRSMFINNERLNNKQMLGCIGGKREESMFIPSFWHFHSSPIPHVCLHQPSNRSEKFLSPPILQFEHVPNKAMIHVCVQCVMHVKIDFEQWFRYSIGKSKAYSKAHGFLIQT